VTCEKAVEIRGVTVGYDRRLIFDQADVAIECGGFVGLIGPNGIGKTTLFRVILGLLRPWSGSVEVLGVPMKTPRQISQVRRQIGYLPQQSQAGKLPISVRDSVLIGRWGSSFHGFRRPSAEDRSAVDDILHRLGLFAYRQYDWRDLSGGLQQRVALARAIVRQPRLILMDEPTTYLDRETQKDIYSIAADLNRSAGIAFLVISHDQLMLERYASRMLTVTAGKIEEISCRN
jgi:zinc transport system ATP-binding protein